VQAARLRDGSRKITHITEVVGMEGDVIITQDLFVYEITGEDANGNLIGQHKSTGIGRPKFWDRARYYGEDKRLAAAPTRGGCGRSLGRPDPRTSPVLPGAVAVAASPGCSLSAPREGRWSAGHRGAHRIGAARRPEVAPTDRGHAQGARGTLAPPSAARRHQQASPGRSGDF
jgi:hypothetical protein